MAENSSSSAALDNTQKLENAIRAVSEKRPPPEIDFTLHTMEDGTQVSTLERVCKGRPPWFSLVPDRNSETRRLGTFCRLKFALNI
jgi:hypothetical protein